jgi:hypothetical protein
MTLSAPVMFASEGAIAQNLPSLEQWQEAGFTPSVDTSPQRSDAGGTRGAPSETSTAATEAADLMALVPNYNRFGVTVLDDPHLLVYLPKATTNRIVRLEVEAVTVTDSADGATPRHQFVHAQEWEVGQNGGIMDLSLPSSIPHAEHPQAQRSLLQPNTDYRWVVLVYDNTDAITGKVEGYIRQIDVDQVTWRNADPNTPAIADYLSSLSPHDQGTFLFQNFVWYDAVKALASAYQDDPAATEADWKQVLKLTGLTDAQINTVLTQMSQNREFIEGDVLL